MSKNMGKKISENDLKIAEYTIDTTIGYMIKDLKHVQEMLEGLKDHKRLIFEDIKQALIKKARRKRKHSRENKKGA